MMRHFLWGVIIIISSTMYCAEPVVLKLPEEGSNLKQESNDIPLQLLALRDAKSGPSKSSSSTSTEADKSFGDYSSQMEGKRLEINDLLYIAGFIDKKELKIGDANLVLYKDILNNMPIEIYNQLASDISPLQYERNLHAREVFLEKLLEYLNEKKRKNTSNIDQSVSLIPPKQSETFVTKTETDLKTKALQEQLEKITKKSMKHFWWAIGTTSGLTLSVLWAVLATYVAANCNSGT